MYYYTILCREVVASNAAVRGSIPFATLPLAAPFHSVRYAAARGSISFHSARYTTVRGSIPFHSIPLR